MTPKKLRESVSAIFYSRHEKTVFAIERQNYLTVFPGYTAFPGGKVDKEDLAEGESLHGLPSSHWNALDREMEEELGFSLKKHQDLIEDVYLLGTAITPEFNPYRFKAHFYVVILKDEFSFDVDSGEAKKSDWHNPKELLKTYQEGHLMAVPPVVEMIKIFDKEELPRGPRDLSLPHIEEREVPMIESLYGVKQFLPLSNTFPPASRTNSFIIGDEPLRLLIDPSPKNEEELLKFTKSIDKVGFDAFFISHHHPDHHEFLNKLVERYPKPVYMSQTTKRFIESKWGKKYLEGMAINLLKEGDQVGTTLGKALKVYEVPGHDEGQLALAPNDLSWFFVGDLIQTVGTVVIGAPEGDMTKYFNSLNKVINLNPRFIIPSHGIAIGGVHKLKMTLKHREHREEQVREALIKGLSEEEILDEVYEGLEDNLRPYALKTIKAHIKRLNEVN